MASNRPMDVRRKYHQLRSWLGLRKSIAMYYWKPFNNVRLKKFYAPFIQAGDLCFDVGAHVGNRTHAWVHLGAKVVAVEPQKICAAYLRKRFRNSDQVSVVEMAVGDQIGTATLFVNPGNPTISTFSGEAWQAQLARDARYPVYWDAREVHTMTTLDALIAEYGLPAFCKLDVENYEFEVLSGLSVPIPALSFEYYPPAIAGALKCLDRLETLGGYEYNWSFGESQRFKSTKWIDYQQIRGIISAYSSRYEYGDIYARQRAN